MGRVTKVSLRNYRSFSDWAELRFPGGKPVVVFGENNSGKSNLASAMELVLGERWPGTHRPEDHELFGRSRENLPIQVVIDVEGVVHEGRYGPRDVVQFNWKFPSGDRSDDPSLAMSFADGESSPYVSNATREQCFCLLIAADRRLNYQLSYSSKWTSLSKLMRKFHEALIQDEDRVVALKEHFESVKTVFREVPEFQTFHETIATHMDDLSANFEYQLEIDFSAYDPSNYFRSLRVFPSQDGEVRAFEELGTGQEQVLAIAFAWAYAQAFYEEANGLFLILEEPESHLHPLAQRWLSRRLRAFASEGLQVMITTHSPAFLNVEDLEGFVRISKEEGASRLRQHSVDSFVDHCRATGAEAASIDTTIQRYAAWSTEEILAGLFARGCALVEGQTEAMALPVFLSRVDFDVEREGVAFIAVGGVGDLAKWWRFFTAYSLPCYAFFDRDEGEDDDGDKRRDLMTAAGLDAVESNRILESAETVEHRSLTMFSRDFESAMRQLFGDEYGRLEEEARNDHGLAGGQAKPLVGRYVAERVELNDDAQGFFARMADRLRALHA